jgi:DNA topoisomerase-1
MTWDVPVKDNCPECGQTLFKKSGRGYKKPFCANSACPNFLPEDKRGYPKKPETQTGDKADMQSDMTKEPAAVKSAPKKTDAKNEAVKKTASAGKK